ncbi:hypothetical protein P9112_004436 [Eukaryota sp. TZLM1-RC]
MSRRHVTSSSSALLSGADTDDVNDADNNLEIRAKRKTQKIKDILEFLAWSIVSFCIFYFTNTWEKVQSGLVLQPFFTIGVVCVLINVALFLWIYIYLVLICKMKPQLTLDENPLLIYVMTFFGVAAFITLMVGSWKIYKFGTPFVMFIYTLTFVIASKYVPL